MEENKNKSVFKKNMILIIIILIIGIVPLLMVKSEFGGSDVNGEDIRKEINHDYDPWENN